MLRLDRRIERLLGVGLLVVAVFGIYGEIAGHHMIDFDDRLYVSGNTHVLDGLSWAGVVWAFSNVDAANYHPITWISHMVDVSLFGRFQGAAFLENAVWHACNAVLLIALLRRLRIGFGLAVACALVFACHPLNVESVAWLSQRKSQLSTFFLLGSICCYVDWRGSARQWLLYASMALYGLSLLSKASAVGLPVVIFAAEFWCVMPESAPGRWLELMRAGLRSAILRSAVFVLVAAIIAGLTFWAQKSAGAVVSVSQVSLMERLLNVVSSFGLYLGKFFWPGELCFFYPFPESPNFYFVGAGVLWFMGVSAVVIATWKTRPYLGLGWLWFLVGMLPVIGVVQVGIQGHADRYMYMPMIGLLLMMADLLSRYFGSITVRPGEWSAACLIAFAAGLGLQAYAYIPYWRRPEVAYRRSVEVGGMSYSMASNLAAAMGELQRRPQALYWSEVSFRIAPTSSLAAANVGISHYNMGHWEDAERFLRLAGELGAREVLPFYQLGILKLRQGKGEEASHCFDIARRNLPNGPAWDSRVEVAREMMKNDAALLRANVIPIPPAPVVKSDDSPGDVPKID